MKTNSNFADISSDEARLLRAGICSFDSASSGVSHEELSQCVDAVITLVSDSMKKANSPRGLISNNSEQTLEQTEKFINGPLVSALPKIRELNCQN